MGLWVWISKKTGFFGFDGDRRDVTFWFVWRTVRQKLGFVVTSGCAGCVLLWDCVQPYVLRLGFLTSVFYLTFVFVLFVRVE